MATTKEQFKGASLVKIQHPEYNVFQAVSNDSKTVIRLYEKKDGTPLGVKDMKTKVIHPLTDANYYDLYKSIRNNDILN